jgi:hypothetical protein
MRRPPLARLGKSPIGLVLVLGLAPLPAFTEELRSADLAAPVVTLAPLAKPAPEAPPAVPTAWVVDRTIPDDPWLAPSAPAPEAVTEVPCDPWNRAADCTDEAEGAVLSNPWPAALAQASAQPPRSEPAPDPADLRLELRGDSIDLKVDVEWAEASVPTSCVPAEAQVKVEGHVADRRVSGHATGKVSPLDLLVIDLGVPEAPFD